MAQPAPALSWVRRPGAEQCIASGPLARRVESDFGPIFVSAAEARWTIEGWVELKPGGGFLAEVVVSDHEGRIAGRRRLQSDSSDCTELSQQVPLVIALLLDPEGSLDSQFAGLLGAQASPEESLLQQLKAGPEPTRAPLQPAPAPAPEEAPQQPEPEPDRGARPGVGLGVAYGRGQLPQPTVGLEMHGEWAWTVWALRLGALAWWPDEIAAGEASVRLWAGQAHLGPCLHSDARRSWTVQGCVEASAGMMRVRGEGFDIDKIQLEPTVGGRLGLDATLALARRWSLLFGASLSVAVLRNEVISRFTQGGSEQLYVAPLLGARGRVGVRWQL